MWHAGKQTSTAAGVCDSVGAMCRTDAQSVNLHGVSMRSRPVERVGEEQIQPIDGEVEIAMSVKGEAILPLQ